MTDHTKQHSMPPWNHIPKKEGDSVVINGQLFLAVKPEIVREIKHLRDKNERLQEEVERLRYNYDLVIKSLVMPKLDESNDIMFVDE